MRKLGLILICIILTSACFSQSKRVALVIGNSNYQNGAPLSNPVNDAEDIGAKLKSAGFTVSLYKDLDQIAMKKAIDNFGVTLEKAEIGLVFYAGHGVQAKGKNYLIPIDAALKTENDVEYNCVDAGRILAKMEDASTRTNIVILDACRNNPFERSWSRNSNGNGLAYMDAPGGSLIAYSTAPGKTAADGYYRNSPFTAGLLEYIDTPNLSLESLFKLVRVKVLNNTKGQQVPWESTSLTGDFYFNPDKDKAQIELGDLLPALQENSIETPDYESLRQTKAAEIRSLAVMPFANYTGDESKAYLASGMHDAVITELGQLSSVRVISKTSTLKYADFQNTIKEVATELNVDGIIETSLISLGEDLRIQVKLYSAFPQEQMLWSEVFISDMSDILNLYNLVAKNIADEIQLSLTPEQELELGKTETVNPEVYDAYLMGLYLLDDGNLESINKAKEYLNNAIEKNPDWAPLYTSLAQVWGVIAQMGFESPEIAGQKIFENLNRALEIDPDNADVHYTLGMTAFLQEWDWVKAEMELLKALAAKPNDAMSRALYAHLLSCLQRNDEALEQAQIAIELDPQNPVVRIWYGATYAFIGDFETALLFAEKVTAEKPDHMMGNNLIELSSFTMGDYNRTIRATEKIFDSKEEEIDFKEVYRIFEESGFFEANKEILRQLEVLALEGYTAPVEIAYRYMIVNNQDKAIEWLEKGFEEEDPVMPYIATKGFFFEPLFDNPRFNEILKKMNLPLPKND